MAPRENILEHNIFCQELRLVSARHLRILVLPTEFHHHFWIFNYCLMKKRRYTAHKFPVVCSWPPRIQLRRNYCQKSIYLRTKTLLSPLFYHRAQSRIYMRTYFLAVAYSLQTSSYEKIEFFWAVHRHRIKLTLWPNISISQNVWHLRASTFRWS